MKIKQIYLKRLFQTATADDLKQICRDHKIKGFSAKKKSGLVELVLTSLSEEELKEVINEKEEKWISKGFDFRKEDVKTIKDLIARLSDTTCESSNLTIGDFISLNGGIVEDSFVGLMVKRATKLKKEK